MKLTLIVILLMISISRKAAFAPLKSRFQVLSGSYLSTKKETYRKTRVYHVSDKPLIETTVDENSYAKRKVALTISYVGSKYYGLQMDPRPEFPTVEAELEEALFKLGCITESNRKALSKIGWSRSSRTDKFVHSARLVISTKLEVCLRWLKGEDGRMFELVESLNLILPAEIRVLSVCKINQGFRAREACSWREYEYLLPKSLLLPGNSSDDDQRVLALFEKNLQRQEGSLSFHNFHRLSPKNLRGRLFTNGESEDDPTDAEDYSEDLNGKSEKISTSNDMNTDEMVALRENHVVPLGLNHDFNSSFSYKFYDTWVPKIRDQTEMTRGTVFACEIIKDEGNGGVGSEFIRLRIRGQSFLLHQIRLMIGASLLIARGILPETAMDMALLSPYFINFPLAPAEGLIVVNAGFERNSNGQAISIFPSKSKIEEGAMNNDKNFSLMTEDEYNVSEKFKEESIYAKVIDDWNKHDGQLTSSFLTYSERFRPSDEVRDQWNSMADRFKKLAHDDQEDRRDKETVRLERNVEDFRFKFIDNGEIDADFDAGEKKREKKGGNRTHFKPQSIPHKRLLPNTISTALITKFRVLPGDDVCEVLRALATLLAKRQLPSNISNTELVAFVEQNGGFNHFLKNMEKHPMIE